MTSNFKLEFCKLLHIVICCDVTFRTVIAKCTEKVEVELSKIDMLKTLGTAENVDRITNDQQLAYVTACVRQPLAPFLAYWHTATSFALRCRSAHIISTLVSIFRSSTSSFFSKCGNNWYTAFLTSWRPLLCEMLASAVRKKSACCRHDVTEYYIEY